jgi:hypothetical protein
MYGVLRKFRPMKRVQKRVDVKLTFHFQKTEKQNRSKNDKQTRNRTSLIEYIWTCMSNYRQSHRVCELIKLNTDERKPREKTDVLVLPLSCFVVSCLVLSCFVVSCFALSCLGFCRDLMPCLVMSCLV